MMDVWIARDGERHGPYTEDEIHNWLRNGQLIPDDLAWWDGLADWQPLRVLLPDAITAARSPVPPPAIASAHSAATAGPVLAHAGFWIRASAWLIDYFILSLPTLVAAYAMGADQLLLEMANLMTQAGGAIDDDTRRQLYVYSAQLRPFTIVSALIAFAYYSLLEASPWQATLGKLACGIRVTGLANQRLSLGHSAVRNLVRLANIVSVFVPLVCYLPIAWSERRQGLHDRLAQALVLRGRAR